MKPYILKIMNSRIEIESLKERINLTRVVGHYVALEKKGVAYLGLCPFHDDHHPSLRVDPAKGLYHCFSCKEGGDAFCFVQKMEGCGFTDAVKICLDICHLSVPDKRMPGKMEKLKKQETPEFPVPTVEENEQFCRSLLPYEPETEDLRAAYAAFGIGLAPADVPKVYGFTARRLVFPIRNATGELVAFAARYQGVNRDKKIPKYLNSSTSPLYKKDELLYAWHVALPEIRRTGTVYLTEGYKDTLAMHAAGFINTVALCGVNLSPVHIGNIRKEASTVCLLLDADETGRGTVAMIQPLLRKAGLTVINLLPEGGKDPDEMFRWLGREAFVGWIDRNSRSPQCRKLESLLSAACLRWPDTCCLLSDGSTQLYRENIAEVLTYENMLPVTTPVSVSDADIDSQYQLHTNCSHSEEVRHSELICYLFLCYQELRLTDRIRILSRQLSLNREESDAQHIARLQQLQYDREYLQRVTVELEAIDSARR